MTKKVKPGTATAAHGLRGIDPAGRQISPINTADAIWTQATTLRIIVTPTANGRKWRATLEGQTLCVSASPLVASARILIAKGFDPNCTIEMWRAGTDAWSLRGRLGAVAATVIDGETASRRAKNGSPVRFFGIAATPAGGTS